MSVRVLLCDDQGMVRAGLRMIIDAEPDMTIAAEAADGVEAVSQARAHRPDVVLMDVRMPRLDGLAATRRILAEVSPAPRVLVLTTFDLDEYVYEALESGASGFLLKDAPADQLVAAIRVVASGEALLAPTVTRRLIEQFSRSRPRRAAPELEELTAREREVLELMARGLSNAEIAARFELSAATVKTHVARVLDKLELRDRVQAVVYAYESGLVQAGAG
ncbi:MAG: response regulator transcription factor [Candidatus Dormibacteraeota bacterium]|nr:response regulator transcription factor [Candidatus Dormibacteraeota bacterium]